MNKNFFARDVTNVLALNLNISNNCTWFLIPAQILFSHPVVLTSVDLLSYDSKSTLLQLDRRKNLDRVWSLMATHFH